MKPSTPLFDLLVCLITRKCLLDHLDRAIKSGKKSTNQLSIFGTIIEQKSIDELGGWEKALRSLSWKDIKDLATEEEIMMIHKAVLSQNSHLKRCGLIDDS